MRIARALSAIPLVVGLSVVALAAFQEPPPPCDNIDRPWMCGFTEEYCGRDGESYGPDDEAKHRHPCECAHTCKMGGKPDDETQGRKWDSRCLARCKTTNCKCAPNHCHGT